MGHPPERLRWAAAPDAAHTSAVEGKRHGHFTLFQPPAEDWQNRLGVIYASE